MKFMTNLFMNVEKYINEYTCNRSVKIKWKILQSKINL